MSNHNFDKSSSSTTTAEPMQRFMANSMQLFSEYCLIYASAFDKFLKSNKGNYTDNYNWANNFNYYYYYDNWLKITDFESNKHLRSKRFLDSFQEYIESMVDLNASMKAIGCFYPVFSLIDNFIDNYYLNAVFSNPVIKFHQTPYEVVQEKDGMRLLRYHHHYYYYPHHRHHYPESPQYKKNTPLLIVYAPINRYHIMDISSDRSIVNKFVSNAFDVFLLDWGNQKNNKLTITDYINYIDEAVEQIKNITKAETISLFGYSWGGVLSTIYSSLYNNNSKIKNLIVQSSHADFDKDNSIIAEWARNFPVEKFVEEFKEMFGHLIDMAFLMRNPLSHIADNIKYTLKMQENGLKFIDNLVHISRWLHNTPDIPGEFFKQFIIDLYQKNLLIQNKMNLIQNEKTMTKTTTAIDLRKITMPILNIVGIYDDLVPSASSIPLNDVISSSDKKLIEFPAGHVELCISSSAHTDLWPQVVKWLEERS
jgi:polyhydroxyalkanoate synthase subunit PhaC